MAACLSIVGSLAASNANANSSVFWRLTCQTAAGSFDTSCPITQGSALGLHSTGTSASFASASVVAAATASIGFGKIGVEVTGAFSAAGPAGTNGGGGSSAFVQVFDLITVQSNSLPIGTPVTLRLNGNIRGAMVGVDQTGANGSVRIAPEIRASWNVQDADFKNSFFAQLCTAKFPSNRNDCQPNDALFSETTSLDIPTRIGARLSLTSEVNAFTSTLVGLFLDGTVAQSGGVFAMNSAYTYFDLPSQDLFLNASSGYNYFTPAPVPEPPAVLLLVAGLFALLGLKSSTYSRAHDRTLYA